MKIIVSTILSMEKSSFKKLKYNKTNVSLTVRLKLTSHLPLEPSENSADSMLIFLVGFCVETRYM